MPSRWIQFATSLTLVAMAPAVAAQQTTNASAPTARASPACASAEHRQFDFWLGEWEVRRADGKLAGRNTITREHGGCVLQERYAAVGGYTGTSLNIYDATRKRWHQTWTDNGGLLLELDGHFRDGKMILRGETLDSAGKVVQERITWTPRQDGKVRQLWEQSADGGATWTVAFDGIYTKQ
ncbi:MAG: hypothetical protein ACREOF_01720 [Gemmatimonadales bacterium]